MNNYYLNKKNTIGKIDLYIIQDYYDIQNIHFKYSKLLEMLYRFFKKCISLQIICYTMIDLLLKKYRIIQYYWLCSLSKKKTNYNLLSNLVLYYTILYNTITNYFVNDNQKIIIYKQKNIFIIYLKKFVEMGVMSNGRK